MRTVIIIEIVNTENDDELKRVKIALPTSITSHKKYILTYYFSTIIITL